MVAITDLAHMQGVAQVFHGSFNDVTGASQSLCSTVSILYRIVGSLQRPWGAVNKPPLVAADDLGALRNPQFGCYFFRGFLDFDLNAAGRWLSVLLAYFRQVGRAFVPTPSTLWIPRQIGHERMDVLRYEGALTWFSSRPSPGW